MDCKNLSIIKILIGLSLSIFLIYIIPENFYPDYDTWKEKFLVVGPKDKQIIYTPQNFIISILSFINLNENVKSSNFLNISDFTRVNFFFVTFALFVTIFCYINIIFRYDINFQARSNLLLTSIIFPSTILSITAFTPEAVYTVLSLVIISMLNVKNLISLRNIYLFPILFYAMIIDEGNFLVLISFVFFMALIYQIYLRNKIRNALLLIMIISFCSIIFGKFLFLFIAELLEIEKMRDLIKNLHNIDLDHLDFQDLVERYLYFWLTLLTLCSANSYPIITYSSFLIIILLVFTNRKIKEKSLNVIFKNTENQVIITSLILFPIIIINILPTHAHAKYYIFTIFFILQILRGIVSDRKLFLIIFIYTFISICEHYFKY